MIQVIQIKNEETRAWILTKHYAHRMPCVQYAYGIYDGNRLQGIVTYGPPPRMWNKGYGAFGEELIDNVFELNRLCIETKIRNAASILVGRSLRLLPRPALVVSYADANVGHIGYVYQATNWLYAGLTAPEHRFVDESGKDVHARTVVSRFGTRAEEEAINQGLTIEEQSGKHRYIQLLGSRKEVQMMRRKLKYKILPYPKGDTKRYNAGGKVETQSLMFGG